LQILHDGDFCFDRISNSRLQRYLLARLSVPGHPVRHGGTVLAPTATVADLEEKRRFIMASPIDLCEARRRPRPLPQCQPPPSWPRRPAALRSFAEEMLREMAFVYQATRTVRESMMEEHAGVGHCQMVRR
jgi:hypothetical protein